MEPLKTSKRLLTWMYIYPAAGSTSVMKRMAYVMFAGLVLFGQFSGTIPHLAFFLIHQSADLEGSLSAFMGFTTFLAVDYIILSFYMQREQVTNIFQHLSIIYDSHKNTDQFKFLAHANNASEQMWELYIKYVKLIVITNFFGCFISTYASSKIIGHFDVNYVIHMTKISLPWDQTSYAGYLAEDVLICMFALTFCIGTGMALLLFISICIHHLAFYEMFKHSIENWNNWNQSNQIRNDKQFISDLIYFQADVKEWVVLTIQVYSSFLLFEIISIMVMMSTSAFNIDSQLQQTSLSMKNPPYNLITIIAQATFGMVNLFIYCYYGKMTTENFANMPDYVYFELKWDKLPVKLQTYIPLMIQNMQKPVYYHGFYVAIMDLNTFLRVCKTVVTYYMMFKTITSE